ncbi:hypothetical protein LCGC14_0690060 [marine sediment metagenome]|uniref:Uncharacterized protein n=1 Tax=marine sediment metagenome TaxID=412755 RepID=A0A0F9R617_9ZZZZ
MTTTAGVIVTEILRRVRDEAGAGHSRSFALDIISHAQRIINRFTGSVTTTGTLTLRPKKLIYDLTGIFTDALIVTEAAYRGEELVKTNFQFLKNVDISWPRSIQGEPQVFAQIGLDLLLIYPVLVDPATVTLTYIKDLGLIPGEDQDMSLPDHAVPLVSDLSTAVLLIRQRDFKPAVELIQKLQKDLGDYRDE